MAVHETSHPLGQDVETIHNSLLTGLDVILDEYSPLMATRYKSPYETEGFGRLKIANMALRRFVWIDVPVAIPAEKAWWVDWGHGPEPSLGRISVRDILFEGFITPFGEKVTLAEKLVFDITKVGVALTLVGDTASETLFGGYESGAYSRFEAMARTEAGLDELVELAQAA